MNARDAELTEDGGNIEIRVPIASRDMLDTIIELEFKEEIHWDGVEGKENDVYGLGDGLNRPGADTEPAQNINYSRGRKSIRRRGINEVLKLAYSAGGRALSGNRDPLPVPAIVSCFPHIPPPSFS